MKTLILIRHAHRDTSLGREKDNGLSEKGKKQRAKLSRYFLRHYEGEKVSLYSSPSKRCVQTLKEIADATKTPIKELKELYEHTPKETAAQFKARLERGLASALESKCSVIALCSHGDWIPSATQSLCGTRIELAKGGWVDFHLNKNEILLKNVFQAFE